MVERFENFTSLIALSSKCIMKIKSHEMKAFGLKGSHVMCLYHIGKNPQGVTSVELSNLCMEDKAAISKTVAELRKKDLISTDSLGSKVYRAKHVITVKGLEVHQHISYLIENIVKEVGEGLSEEERSIFYKSLQQITENLSKICDNIDNINLSEKEL